MRELYLILGLIILIALLMALFLLRKKAGNAEPNYRLLFILGVTWLPLGIATENPGFWGMGAVFMIAGLVNRKKWRDEPKWSELPPEQQKIKLILIIGLTVLLVAGVLAFFLAK